MKNPLLITLLFVVVLPVVGQKTKHSPTDDYLQTKDTTYLPKTPKNELSCDFELILSSNLTYKRIISDKIAIGVTGGLGFALVNVWNRKGNEEPVTSVEKITQKMEIEGVKIGLIVNYQINKYIYYEFSPQITSFVNFDVGGDSFLGIKNSLFFSVKKFYLGFSSFAGSSIINQNSDTGFVLYTSLLILRVPIKKW